jgi:HSP20 family molecular chaperone IbpA
MKMSDIAKTKQSVWVYPAFECDCECSEDETNTYRLTYEIPGVKKEDIHLKAVKNAIRLVAHKGDIDYINEFLFQCNVDEKGILAGYEDGILTVDAPYDCPDPFKEADLIKIN